MVGLGSFLLLSAAVFSGAFISSLAGFAFSAVAGGILLHIMAPLEAVPLMMACSIGVQASNLWALRKHICWTESLALVAGGLLGVPVAVSLLSSADATLFREGFGAAVALYAGYMLFRPGLQYLQTMHHGRNALVGFGGGLIGGLTAMPGALPTIWCDLHGVPKNRNAALFSPSLPRCRFLHWWLCLPETICLPRFLSICPEHSRTPRRLGARHICVSQRRRIDIQANHPDRLVVIGCFAFGVIPTPLRTT